MTIVIHSILPEIAKHGLDLGVGAACAAIEGLALIKAKQLKNSVSLAEKSAKYILITIAILAALGATFAFSVASGGGVLKRLGLPAAENVMVSTALITLFAQTLTFKALFKKDQEKVIP